MSFILITYMTVKRIKITCYRKRKKINYWSLQSLYSHSFFKSFPVWDHTFMTFIWKVGGGWGRGVLKFGTCLRINRSLVHFCRWEVGWGSKIVFVFFVNVIIVWQLILKVTSIKRNVFRFSLLRFKLTFYTHTKDQIFLSGIS